MAHNSFGFIKRDLNHQIYSDPTITDTVQLVYIGNFLKKWKGKHIHTKTKFINAKKMKKNATQIENGKMNSAEFPEEEF